MGRGGSGNTRVGRSVSLRVRLRGVETSVSREVDSVSTLRDMEGRLDWGPAVLIRGSPIRSRARGDRSIWSGPGAHTLRSSPSMNPSLRIAIVLNPFTLRRTGGVHAPFMAAELLGRGHRVRVVGDLAGTVPQSSLAAGGDADPAPLEGAGLGAFDPDVVVAYDGRSPAALRGARVARRSGAPLVLVEEGFPEHGKTIERILRGFGTRAWGSLVQRTTARVVALDPVASAEAVRQGFEDERVIELAAGVDVSTYRPGLSSERRVRHRLPEHVLLVVGRMEPGRGIEALVDAFARTVGQNSDWALVLAGEGTLRAALRAQCERLGVSARVRWIGRPGEEELPGLLGTATALLVPALDDDVASQKIRRAMACGTPVLVSDVDRLRGTVEHEETGLVVPPGDREAWKEAIARLASDPARRARWGRTARERAVEEMTWPHVASRFEEILRDAVEESERARFTASGTDDALESLDEGDGASEGDRLPTAS